MAALFSLRRTVPALVLGACAVTAHASDDAFRAAVVIDHGYDVHAGQTYASVSGRELKLDVYTPAAKPVDAIPVVINIHGGGWVFGSREGASLTALPYMQIGFAVVNIEYRLAKTALAPAAVEDALCALQWVGRNAKRYNFDLGKVVVTGTSAGGHLALATGMIKGDSPFTNQCAANEPAWAGPYVNVAPKVAAVINWYGITDVADMLQGPNVRSYAVQWFGSMADRMAVAAQVSPLSHVRKDGPPVLTIHGDADPLVPYAHATRLHAALNKAGVKNQLVTIKGGGHGGFTLEQHIDAYEATRAFLGSLGIVPAAK
ncbi:alpha/beta hydrolase [Massilia cavernae]|uniref:Alpha/beta hydrolase n=1 Tax=Massilia cavernae TaxID=2320864 RepID=A0A418Y7J4_9BURK|nr:alpha/beta hydrolase [Massilia cavernae]RJG25884.1 alpha/beta hydrolase [Massilia cavernae]